MIEPGVKSAIVALCHPPNKQLQRMVERCRERVTSLRIQLEANKRLQRTLIRRRCIQQRAAAEPRR